MQSTRPARDSDDDVWNEFFGCWEPWGMAMWHLHTPEERQEFDEWWTFWDLVADWEW